MIDLRPWRLGDEALILHSWRKVLRSQGPKWLVSPERYKDPSYMPANFFDRFVVPQLAKALNADGAVVACSKTDDDLVYGFRVGNPGVTHFVFVKSPYRRMGVCRALFTGVETNHRYTMSTPTERRIRQRGHVPEAWRLSNDAFWTPT